MFNNWKKQFAIIYSGQAFSILGSAAVQFAIIWWLTIQTQSALTLSIAAVVSMLPFLMFGAFAGVWIDRLNRRTVMMLADGMVALSSVILGIAFWYWPIPPVWFMYLILFLRGTGNTFHAPAMQAAIPTLVPADMLTKAGGWANLINSLSNMLGPVLGAALMAVLPIWAIMLVDIAGALFAVGCLMFVRIPDVQRTRPDMDMLADVKSGFAAVRENKALMAVFLPMLLLNILYMPLGSLFPLLVRTHFQGNAWHNSLVEFFFAGGLLVSSLLLGVWGGLKKRFLMVSMAITVMGLGAWTSGAVNPDKFWLFVVCCLVMGFSGSFINVPLMAYIQETIAPDMMGKVFSLIMMLMTLSMPVGLLIAGPVSEVIGIDRWFLLSGVAMVANGILFYVRTRTFDEVRELEGS